MFRKDTLTVNFPGFSTLEKDTVITVIVKRFNDVIETKSVSKNGMKLDVNFYLKNDGKLLLVTTKEISPKDNSIYLSWTLNFQNDRITKVKSTSTLPEGITSFDSNVSKLLGYNLLWTEEFIKKYSMTLFAKIKALS
ncbi:hypothetical protein HYN48_14000 [Flavobacterium magnum]|uniref:Uncharacterized protein n=2 Tax=Flavobacterium magnum TaxID=2162713 RepID=A0A2S0RK65_9FLAO|nr:hypothetical protein HYN48_14000 [Flavobacterium magnum]